MHNISVTANQENLDLIQVVNYLQQSS